MQSVGKALTPVYTNVYAGITSSVDVGNSGVYALNVETVNTSVANAACKQAA